MERLAQYFWRIFSASLFCLILALARPAVAQTMVAPLDGAATQIAVAITHAKLKTVVVFDFPGPDDRLTQMGVELAASFRAALARSGPKFRVEDVTQVNKTLAANSYSPLFIFFPDFLLAPAQDAGASALVSGRLSVDGNRITVALIAYRCDSGKGVLGLKVSWPLTEDSKALLDKILLSVKDRIGPQDIPNAGTSGYTTPSCLTCPRADYSSEAANMRIEGVVELVGTVDTDGRFKDIRVLRPLAYGLTHQAILAVEKWKLAPAHGPDGSPAAVRQMVEVAFRLY